MPDLDVAVISKQESDISSLYELTIKKIQSLLHRIFFWQLLGMVLTNNCHQHQLPFLYNMTRTFWQSVNTHAHMHNLSM